MAGDINDFGRQDYWKSYYPFGNDDEFKKFKVSSNGVKPPNSCCQTNRKNTISDRAGIADYILINNTMKYTQQNIILPGFNPVADTFPTSDHMPVTATVEFKK